jgi:CheY-like chemotaxis protein
LFCGALLDTAYLLSLSVKPAVKQVDYVVNMCYIFLCFRNAARLLALKLAPHPHHCTKGYTMNNVGDILIVDDDQPIVDFVTEALADEGYTVRSAFSVASALAAMAVRIPDLVIIDLHMPGKTGDVFVRNLRHDGHAHLPVVLMTADAASAKRLDAEEIAGCLLKPFDLDDLLACVAKYIRPQPEHTSGS